MVDVRDVRKPSEAKSQKGARATHACSNARLLEHIGHAPGPGHPSLPGGAENGPAAGWIDAGW
jgi:hypothetical protein